VIHRLVACAGVSIMLASCGGGGGSGSAPPPAADTAAPNTTLAGAPATLTNSSSASLTFSASETATFEVRLDGGAFAAATSPHSLTNLADGSHTFEVRARDAAGNVDPSPAIATWTVDTAAPDTQLTVSPPPISQTASATFGATSPDATATFEVSVDGGAFVAATLPFQTTVSAGAHSVAIRARDAAGNVDATPASSQWTYDNLSPDTQIAAQPAAITNQTTATLAFFSATAGATFEASVNGGAYAPATSPLQLAGLAEGAHEVLVRARDATPRVDPTPAVVAWRVDLTSPTVRVIFPTAVSYTDASTLIVRGTAQDSQGVAGVEITGVAATSSDEFATWSVEIPVAAGTNTLPVQVQDRAGNTGGTALPLTIMRRGPIVAQQPMALAFDPTGGRILISDIATRDVIGFRESDGAGSVVSAANRSATPALSGLSAMVVDAANNRVIAVDSQPDSLVAIDLATGARTTLSTGDRTGDTRLFTALGLALDAVNNRVFATVRDTRAIVAVNLATGARSVVSNAAVGTGPAFEFPASIAFDTTTGTDLYVGDSGGLNPTVYRVDIATGNRIVFSQSITAGMTQGPAFFTCEGLALDSARVWLYMATGNGVQRILMNGANRGNREMVASNQAGGGSGEPVQFVRYIALNAANDRLFALEDNGEVLSIDIATRARSVLVQSRVGAGSRPVAPWAVAIEQTSGHPQSLLGLISGKVERIDLATGNRTLVSGSGAGAGPPFAAPYDLARDTRAGSANSALVLDSSGGTGSIVSVDLTSGNRTTLASLGTVNIVRHMKLDAANNRVFFVDSGPSNAHADDAFYSLDLATGVRTLVSGTDRGTGVAFNDPSHIALEPVMNPTRAIVGNRFTSQLLSIDLATGNRSTLLGPAGIPPLTPAGPLYVDTARSQLIGTNLWRPFLYSVPIPLLDPQIRTVISGDSDFDRPFTGRGPLWGFADGMDVHPSDRVAFVGAIGTNLIAAVDLVTGERVVVAH
jgi:hypothetical protein